LPFYYLFFYFFIFYFFYLLFIIYIQHPEVETSGYNIGRAAGTYITSLIQIVNYP